MSSPAAAKQDELRGDLESVEIRGQRRRVLPFVDEREVPVRPNQIQRVLPESRPAHGRRPCKFVKAQASRGAQTPDFGRRASVRVKLAGARWQRLGVVLIVVSFWW